jgi:hypothetical protein
MPDSFFAYLFRMPASAFLSRTSSPFHVSFLLNPEFLLLSCARATRADTMAAQSPRKGHSNVLGSRLSPRETNSSRAGFILRRHCSTSASAGWRAQRRPRYGRYSLWTRNSLASRGGRRRQTPYPRAARFAAAQTTRKRGRHRLRIPGEHQAPSLDSRHQEIS